MGEKTKNNKEVRLCVNNPIPAVLNAWVGRQRCQGRGKLETLVMKTKSNAIRNHSGVFAYPARFTLRDGEDAEVGKGNQWAFITWIWILSEALWFV